MMLAPPYAVRTSDEAQQLGWFACEPQPYTYYQQIANRPGDDIPARLSRYMMEWGGQVDQDSSYAVDFHLYLANMVQDSSGASWLAGYEYVAAFPTALAAMAYIERAEGVICEPFAAYSDPGETLQRSRWQFKVSEVRYDVPKLPDGYGDGYGKDE